jgi:hypothetical protein
VNAQLFFDCVTVNVCPAMVSVPVRASPSFDATLNVTDPLPVPDAPLVIVIQSTLDAAVHEQVAPVVTDTVPVLPPSDPTDALVGEIE